MFLDRPGCSRGPCVWSLSKFFNTTFTWFAEVEVEDPMDNPKYVYTMKGLIELSNFAVETVSSKCTTPSETKSKGEVKMYRNCMGDNFQLNFEIWRHFFILNLMYIKVVKLDENYHFAEEYFQTQ